MALRSVADWKACGKHGLGDGFAAGICVGSGCDSLVSDPFSVVILGVGGGLAFRANRFHWRRSGSPPFPKIGKDGAPGKDNGVKP
jgi:hypothetical protein